MDASFVLDGLYLGSLDSVCVTDKLKKLGLTHILTIEARPVARHITKGYDTKFVHAFDMDSQDILQHIDECIQYIDTARAAGGVIVHCFVGQSRSATVVLAYLMQKMDLTLADALAMLRCARPMVRPNTGFMQQLELFEAMGNMIDKTNNAYKMFRLENLAMHMQEAQCQSSVPEDMLSADPSLGQAADLGQHYRCKKCRRPLFKELSKLEHHTGKGGAAFDWRSRLTNTELGLEEETEICKKSPFIEPAIWMKDDVLQQAGKLSCPKCHAKIGSFSWFGEHCPCGTWVTPAFHIQPSKVDECRPRIQVSLPAKRPPFVPAAAAPSIEKSTVETAQSPEQDSLSKDMANLKT